MRHLKNNVGKTGEKLAAEFLKRKGYEILQRNYRSTWGEIDIIAKDADLSAASTAQTGTLVFVEVKTRRSLKFGAPQVAVTNAKQQKMSKTALEYLQEKSFFDCLCRFDIISIVLPPNPSEPIIEHIENAFELSEEYVY